MNNTIEQAAKRIEPYILRTPCRYSSHLSAAAGAEVYLKLENLQMSGSFKLRGVVNKMLSLSSNESRRLMIAASTGNHAAAFAHALEQFGFKGKLFMPESVKPVKLEAIHRYGVPFELIGDDCVETEIHAAGLARENDYVLIPPYNDPEIIIGQGTIGFELADEPGGWDAILVPVGGGGLISGIAACWKTLAPETTIIGCQPVNSCVMHASIKAGSIVEQESRPTISDATAGGIEPGSLSFDYCRMYVDDFVLLSEQEIISAIRIVFEHEDMTIEGGAALPVAALLKDRERFAGKRVALIISGGRIDEDVLKGIGCRHEHDRRS
jgi:threonine dehydratase